ncbi:MAG: 4Fe-4S binding protein [Euryarchaeota archaeon]|nr:4Fe-4S binding protein [Euryarchaeota archaeon]
MRRVLVLLCADRPDGDLGLEGADEVMECVRDLCHRPDEAERRIKATRSDRLVLLLCDGRPLIAEFQAAAIRAGLDPLGIQIPPPPGKGDGRPVMVDAAVARARAFEDSPPEGRKARLARSLSRRALFTGVHFEYQSIPVLAPRRCAFQTGCRACVRACPFEAIETDGGLMRIDPGRCTGCDLCVSACPTGALMDPAFSSKMIEAQVRAILETAPAPAGLVFACAGNVPLPMAEGWYPVEVPCTRMVPPTWLIAGLLLGASQVALVPCTSACRSARETSATEGLGQPRSTRAAEAILKASDLPDGLVCGPERLTVEPAPNGMPRASVTLPFDHDAPPRVVAALAAATNRSLRIEDPALSLGEIRLGDACTLCGTCAMVCPTGALRTEETGTGLNIAFHPSLCVGCALCLPACPEPKEGAIRLLRVADSALVESGRRVLKREAVVSCRKCSSVIASASMQRRILTMIGTVDSPSWASLCLDCRAKGVA